MLTQAQLIKKVAEELDVTQKQVKEVLNKFIEVSFNELQETGSTNLFKLGKLVVYTTKERNCHNFQGGTIHVPSHKTVKYKKSKFIKNSN